MAKQRERRQMNRSARRRWQVIGLAAVVVVAGVVVYFAYRAAANLPGAVVADQGNRHIQSESDPHEPYNTDPPTSGPHLPYIAPWGIHTRPIVPELQAAEKRVTARSALPQKKCTGLHVPMKPARNRAKTRALCTRTRQ